MTNHEIASDLEHIQREMSALLKQAERLLRGTPEHERAYSYWVAHIKCALSNEHGYMSRGMCTMQDTIEALENDDCEEGEE